MGAEGLRKLPNDMGREMRGGDGAADRVGINNGTELRMVRENVSRGVGSLHEKKMSVNVRDLIDMETRNRNRARVTLASTTRSSHMTLLLLRG